MKMKRLKYSHIIYFALLNFLVWLKFREVNDILITITISIGNNTDSIIDVSSHL